jgi:chemotaxis protein methyltransferase CheR
MVFRLVTENALEKPILNDAEWRDLSRLVYETVGIKLSDAKRIFLVSRLLKRLRATHTSTFREYFELLRESSSGSGGELQNFINAVTTNKTDFFREAEHFAILRTWLEDERTSLYRARSSGLRIWCAAASTGEEPYTIAAVLQDCLSATEFDRVTLVASDVDTQVLEVARRGVYKASVVESVANGFRARMFVQGRGAYREQFRIRRALREKVKFVQQNLVARNWIIGDQFDIVFCRNVLIYFDRATQQDIVERLLERTSRHGLLFLGHSESINGFSVSAKSVAHAVYSPLRKHSIVPEIIPERSIRQHTQSKSDFTQLRNNEIDVLKCGEGRLGSKNWLKLTLNQSHLLLVYSAHEEINFVIHVSSDNTTKTSKRIRDAFELLNASLTRQSNSMEFLRAKIVCAADSTWASIIGLLENSGIRIEKRVRLPNHSSLWVEPHSGRIIVKRPKLRG